MIREERLLKVLRAPHVSEKASAAMEKSLRNPERRPESGLHQRR